MRRKPRKATKAALGYVRVSTDEQAKEGVSLDTQEARIRDYCSNLGLDLVDVIRDEGVSGTTPIGERAGGSELLSRLEAGEAGHVVMLALDRLSRDTVDAQVVIRAWTKAGLSVHFTNGGAVDMVSATGRAHVGMQSVMAAYWRDAIAERTREALARKRQRGEWVGRPPEGFRVEGTSLVAEGPGVALRQRARALRAEGLSYAAIAARLNDEGWKPLRAGKRFYDSTVYRMLTGTASQSRSAEEAA